MQGIPALGCAGEGRSHFLAEDRVLALYRAAWRLACFLLLAIAVLPAAARAQTVVSLTFDDGIKTQMQIRSSLTSHGMRGTFFINSGTIGTGSYNMTWADVDALNADGNEIGGHTVDHKRLTDLTASEQRAEICNDATTLRSHGYTINNFAYPYGAGSGSSAARQALRRLRLPHGAQVRRPLQRRMHR